MQNNTHTHKKKKKKKKHDGELEIDLKIICKLYTYLFTLKIVLKFIPLKNARFLE